MTTSTITRIQTLSPSRAILAGAIAGLGGGIVFGAMMGMQGMLPMVGMLVRQENALIGFVVHLVISAFIGAVYGLAASRLPANYGIVVIAGAINGVVWWVLGALLLMPVMLGMNEIVFVIGQMQWMSLLGHLIYGVITAALFVPLSQRI